MHIVEMKNLVTKLLGPPEEIGMCGRFPNHHQRWMIFKSEHLKVYLHHSASDASSNDFLPYPARLISIGLAKSYARKSGNTLEVSGDRAAWMVLIAES